MMFRRLLSAPLRMRRAFLQGPLWLREPPFITFISKYYRSAGVMLFFWAMAWYERLLSRPARLLLIVFFVCSFYSSVSTRSPALILLGLLLAGAITDLLAGWLFRPRLLIKRTLPHRVTCHLPFEIRYDMENKSRFLPAADLLPEPYGEGKYVDRPDGLNYLTLHAGEQKETLIRFLPLRRGELVFPCAMAESVFPFNIFKHAVRTGERETILVHPFHQRLKRLSPDGSARRRSKAANTLPLPGQSMDFLGCRKFQNGDMVRRIHWRASARHNTLIVKEFQQERQARSAILADTFLPGVVRDFSLHSAVDTLFRKDAFSTEDLTMEAVLSLAASVAETLTAENARVTHFTCSGTWQELPDAPGSYQLLLDQLAYARPCLLHDPLPGLTTQLESFAPELENIFVVIRRWDDRVLALRYLLSRFGVPACFCLVSQDPAPRDLPDEVRILKPADILSGKADAI